MNNNENPQERIWAPPKKSARTFTSWRTFLKPKRSKLPHWVIVKEPRLEKN